MTTDNRTGRTTDFPEPEPRSQGATTRLFVRRPGRLPQPVVCALAVVTVPLALHLFAVRPTNQPPVPEGTPVHAARVSASTAPATPKASPTSADAPSEPGSARPADTSSFLRADRLVLRAVGFRGVVTVRTAAGPVRVLKFTVRSVDAVGLHMTVGRGDTATRLETGPTATATFTGDGSDGVLTLHVHQLSGTVTALGGAPLPHDRTVTVTTDSVPPWLAHPAAPARTIAFADATVSPVGRFGGDLSVSGPLLRSRAG
ncbi:hypothetical protein [Streptomyces sp. NBC_01435]|uniref:hypothetical protein n=1 Tax=Streptomyces sp. NBC_01435 TaxID=2903865 RepID=UPI002E381645|nr:hypothetical protein [Streptomyces sp. NBC_01435]